MPQQKLSIKTCCWQLNLTDKLYSMGLFSFLKPPKPVRFTYHPRFYDEKKDDFQERLRKAREKSGDDPESMKMRIRESLNRKGGYHSDHSYRSKQVHRSNMILLVVVVLLVLFTYIAIELYLPRIIHLFE
jgi:hypothetical protein